MTITTYSNYYTFINACDTFSHLIQRSFFDFYDRGILNADCIDALVDKEDDRLRVVIGTMYTNQIFFDGAYTHIFRGSYTLVKPIFKDFLADCIDSLIISGLV